MSFFGRDKNAHEIDCFIEYQNFLIPIEIKSAQPINGNFFEC
jgi:hypothetical protein